MHHKNELYVAFRKRNASTAGWIYTLWWKTKLELLFPLKHTHVVIYRAKQIFKRKCGLAKETKLEKYWGKKGECVHKKASGEIVNLWIMSSFFYESYEGVSSPTTKPFPPTSDISPHTQFKTNRQVLNHK